jgi:hypothetical protein
MMPNQSKAARATVAITNTFRSFFMRRKPEWNRMGPKLPLWFTSALKTVDSRLVLQYIPPRTRHPGGVNAGAFPAGIWYICGTMKHNPSWITKRAVFALVDKQGRPVKPTRDLIRLLRAAKYERNREGADRIEEAFERSVARAAREKDHQSREKLMEDVAASMRQMNMRSSMKPKVLNIGIPQG